MCFVLALFRVHPRYPLIVAANREEARARPATPPFHWPETPPLWAGRDEVAGGTWLGVNGHGMLVAITNRRAPAEALDPGAPSRGLLCLQTLRQPGPVAARAFLSAELAAHCYNPFNLLCATVDEGWAATWQGDAAPLVPGPHVLTSRGGLDDPRQPRIRRALGMVRCLEPETASLEPLLADLGRLCADTSGPDPICRPDGERGTVSSSLIALDASGSIAAYWHADGPPSEIAYRAVGVVREEVAL